MNAPPYIKEGEWAIILTQNNGIPGRFIQWRYACDVTHVALITKVNGAYLIYDSDFRWFSSGFTCISWNKWKHKGRYIEHIIVTPEMIDWNRLVSLLGTRYDLRAWFKHLGVWRKWKKEPDSADATTCWEAIYYVLRMEDWWKGKPTRFKQDLMI